MKSAEKPKLPLAQIGRKPAWLKIRIDANERYTQTKKIIEDHHLHTICSSGRCPNRGECWGNGTATFMIGGDICTRNCKFCNTQTGRPHPLAADEPAQVARSIQLMHLKHAVITSVDRDDLEDGGASHWAATIRKIKEMCPKSTLEVLIPDFQGNTKSLDAVIKEKPEIISHNMETVKRLSPQVRSAANYDRSLKVLKYLAQQGAMTKSGMMLGLGETEKEVMKAMDDLRAVNCHILTLGQYLQPTLDHWPVTEYITPEQFDKYKEIALAKGFRFVESAPLVRSSYHADRHVQ